MTRNSAPGLGAVSGPYIHKGEFQVNAGISRFETDDEIRGVDHRVDLYKTNSQVNEGGVTLDVQGSYGLSRQFSVSVDVPVVLYSHWSTKLAGVRYDQPAHGIADAVFSGTFWLWNCERYPEKNVSFTMGIRAPTGNSDYKVLYPNNLGQDFKMRPVFPGIQPGSGAWGWRIGVDGFQRIKRFTVFGTGIYTFSLRDQNNTYALGVTLNPAGVTATAPRLRFISTPDSYLFNIGTATSIPKVSRVTAFVQGRIAGVPVHNVLTRTIGFRQPGYYVTVEPGLAFSTKWANYTVSSPIRVTAATRPNFTGAPVSSDFTHYSIVGSISFRFGGNKAAAPSLGADSPEAINAAVAANKPAEKKKGN